MSWDNNNLACILVFPPWQRKGLGSLLMGVSYEISRRERVLGGPEKPISDLGRKGYKRFWAGEIARWLLELDLGVAAGAGSGASAHHPGDGGEVDVDAVAEDDGVVDEAVSDEKAGHGGSGHAAAPAPAGDDGADTDYYRGIAAPKERVRAWLEDERLPVELGWAPAERQLKVVDIFGVASAILAEMEEAQGKESR